MSVPAGWYPDPAGSAGVRWFDGADWTSQTRPVTSTDVIAQGPDSRLTGTARAPLWRRGRVVGAAAAILLAAAGTVFVVGRSPSTSVPVATSSPRTGAVAPPSPPRVGDCHGYDRTAMQLSTDPAPAVSCTGANATALTIGVVPLAAGTPLPFEDHPTSEQAAGRMCQSQLDDYLGGGPGLQISLLSVAFFEPTAEQLTAGQRWVRCDVYLAGVAPTGKPVLVPLPKHSLKGALGGAGAWTYALCAKPQTQTGTGWFTMVDCRSAGARVAVLPVPIAANGAPYPGLKQATALATRACNVASRWYGGLRLSGVAESAKAWAGGALCLASPAEFRSWLAAGRPFTSPQNTA